MVLKAVAVWLAMAVLAVANGIFREKVVTPRLGDRVGHVTSTLLLAIAIWILTLLTVHWIGVRDRSSALELGVAWVVATLGFEFLAGHYAFGNPWSKIFADYNLLRGRIWLLIPLTILIAPVTAVTLSNP